MAYFLGDERACDLYTKILKSLLLSFQERSNPNIEVFVFSAEPIKRNKEDKPFLKAAPPYSTAIDIFQSYAVKAQNIYLQEGPDLGMRMANAFWKVGSEVEKRMAPKSSEELDGESTLDLPLLLAGTDQPEYNPALAYALSQKLNKYDALLGPACDGGYYLVGFSSRVYKNKDLLEQVFREIKWSSHQVFEQQQENFAKLGLKSYICPQILQDIDTFADLCAYQKNHENTKEAASMGGLTKLSLAEYKPDIRVILPVLDEASSLNPILEKLKASSYFSEIICADNGSTDGSIEVARKMGARVTHCKRRGYGSTCLKALADIRERGGCEVILFLDADGSDDLTELYEMLARTVSENFDLCLGARLPKIAESGALLPHARFGNWLATSLISLFWGFRYQDLGPMRAIRWSALEKLEMDDLDFGWTVQMQVRALKKKLRIIELPVAYRKRSYGKSKISASLRNSLKAGYVILKVIFRELLS